MVCTSNHDYDYDTYSPRPHRRRNHSSSHTSARQSRSVPIELQNQHVRLAPPEGTYSLAHFGYEVEIPDPALRTLDENFYEIRFHQRLVARLKPASDGKQLVVDCLDLVENDGRPQQPQGAEPSINYRPYASELLIGFWTATLGKPLNDLDILWFTMVTEPSMNAMRQQIYDLMGKRLSDKNLRICRVAAHIGEVEAFDMILEHSSFGIIANRMVEQIRQSWDPGCCIHYFDFEGGASRLVYNFGVRFGGSDPIGA